MHRKTIISEVININDNNIELMTDNKVVEILNININNSYRKKSEYKCQYNCPRCDYFTDVAQRYSRHIQRKKYCTVTKLNVSLKNEYKQFAKEQEQKKKRCKI